MKSYSITTFTLIMAFIMAIVQKLFGIVFVITYGSHVVVLSLAGKKLMELNKNDNNIKSKRPPCS